MDKKESEENQIDALEILPYRFIETMINLLEENVEGQKAAEIIGQCCNAHHGLLDIEALTQKYSGDIISFIEYIESMWGWKIFYNESRGIIEIDENKPFCVCPLVQKGGIKNPLLCHCSEGFAKKMFSDVIGKPAKAQVVKSILRGDESCVYRITIGEYA